MASCSIPHVLYQMPRLRSELPGFPRQSDNKSELAEDEDGNVLDPRASGTESILREDIIKLLSTNYPALDGRVVRSRLALTFAVRGLLLMTSAELEAVMDTRLQGLHKNRGGRPSTASKPRRKAVLNPAQSDPTTSLAAATTLVREEATLMETAHWVPAVARGQQGLNLAAGLLCRVSGMKLVPAFRH